MATTRDELVPLKKQSLLQNVAENNQYSNFNLNQSHKCLKLSAVQSDNSKTISNNKGFDAKIIDDEKRSSRFWNKSTSNNLHSKSLKSFSASDKAEKNAQTKRWKNASSNATTKNSSTLSLHIAAYENSVQNDTVSLGKNESSKKALINGQKQILINSALNPFEFPRQQKDDEIDPAVMQFTASQKLRNPNQLGSSKNNQQGIPSPEENLGPAKRQKHKNLLKKEMSGTPPSRNKKLKLKSKEGISKSKQLNPEKSKQNTSTMTPPTLKSRQLDLEKSKQNTSKMATATSMSKQLDPEKSMKNTSMAPTLKSKQNTSKMTAPSKSKQLDPETSKQNASKMTEATPKSKDDSRSYRKFRELQKRNNDREDQILRRLTALVDDDCKVLELRQAVSMEHQLVKRLDYGLNDHTNLFKGNLSKSVEYLAIIQQYRRMQAHKMAILLDQIDEECKRMNQLVEDHFEDINCVYQLMKPDATPKELMVFVFRHVTRTFQSFCQWATAKQK